MLQKAHSLPYMAGGKKIEPENDIVQFLRRELTARCKKNPRYGLRAFARSLDVDPSTLTKILNRKRKLGTKAIYSICQKLDLPKEKTFAFTSAPRTEPVSDAEFKKIGLDLIEEMSEWYYFSIIELIEVKGFKPSVETISQSLGLTQQVTQDAINRLVKLKFIAIDENGLWKSLPGHQKTSTLSTPFTTAAHKKMQTGILNKSIAALEQVPVEERMQYSLTFGVNSKWLPHAREVIKEFGRGLMKLMGGDQDIDRVYLLSVSLFPTSEKTKKEDHS